MPSFKKLAIQKEMLAAIPWQSFTRSDFSVIPDLPGVYCIASAKNPPDESTPMQLLYINQTDHLKKQLTDYATLTTLATSKLETALINDPHLTAITTIEAAHRYLINTCYYKYLQLDTMRECLFLEHSLKFTLSPRYLTVRTT